MLRTTDHRREAEDTMRNQVQDQHISFRANAAVTAALSSRAEKAGCSVSEYLRGLVREKVGLQ